MSQTTEHCDALLRAELRDMYSKFRAEMRQKTSSPNEAERELAEAFEGLARELDALRDLTVECQRACREARR